MCSACLSLIVVSLFLHVNFVLKTLASTATVASHVGFFYSSHARER